MLQLHADQHTIISAAHRLIIRKYEIEKLSRKIEKFYELDFVSFLKELTKKNKALKTMKLDDEQRLEERFLDQSKQINDYQEKIDRLDEKIDTMVFDLYELSREEREVVLEG
jgi:predicted  nucleic acid-binding Zn-ribbon protein